MNMYAYSANDPLNRRDPFGLEGETVCETDPSRCAESLINIEMPEGKINPDTGDITFEEDVAKGFREKTGESDSKDESEGNSSVVAGDGRPGDPVHESVIPPETAKQQSPDGVGPIGLEAVLREWDTARERREAAQKRGDMQQAAFWDQRATQRMIDYYALSGVKLNPKDYPVGPLNH